MVLRVVIVFSPKELSETDDGLHPSRKVRPGNTEERSGVTITGTPRRPGPVPPLGRGTFATGRP